MKNTKNYGLGKPELTEFYDINVQNDNMDVIDEKLATLSSDLGSVSNRAGLFHNLYSFSTVGGFPTMAKDIADKWGEISVGAGLIRFSNNATMFHGTYQKYNDTNGSITFHDVRNNDVYVWAYNNGNPILGTLALNSELFNNIKSYQNLNFDNAEFGVYTNGGKPSVVGATNYPVDTTGLLVCYKTDGVTNQTYHTYVGEVYSRSKYYSTEWSAWEKLALKSDLANYLPLTGGTVSGDINQVTTDASKYITNLFRNTTRKLYEQLTPNGVYYLYDETNNKKIIGSTADGTNTFNGTASGNIPITGGVATGTIGVEKTDDGESSVRAKNSVAHIDMLATSSGNVGLYDRGKNLWLLQSLKNGGVTLNGTSTNAIADANGNNIANTYATKANVQTAKQEAINTILGEAVSADFDTLQEVADWIQSDTTKSAELITRVTNVENSLPNYLPLSGGYVDGNLTVYSANPYTRSFAVQNAVKRIGHYVDTDGLYAIKDITDGEDILSRSADGVNTFNGTASGNLKASDFTVDGDTLILNFL